MHQNLEVFVRQWDTICTNSQGQYAKIDCLHWFNYLAFDMIGDLAFGQPFGMLEKGKDITEIRMTPDAPITYAPAVQVLNRRGEVSGTLGCLPQLKPIAKYLPDPFFSQGLEAVQNLAGIAVARVAQRLDGKQDPGRVDLLARLMEGKDEKGEKLGREELTAEALTQLIAGSDTTSNTSCAILYWVLKTPGVLQKLQKELDQAIPVGTDIPTFDTVKDLKYMQNVINETLRIHSTSSLGKYQVLGMFFPIWRWFPVCGSVQRLRRQSTHKNTGKKYADSDFLGNRPTACRASGRRHHDSRPPLPCVYCSLRSRLHNSSR